MLTAPAGTFSAASHKTSTSRSQLDDLPGDHFVGEVGSAFNGRSGRFECDAHETGGPRFHRGGEAEMHRGASASRPTRAGLP